MEFTVRTTDVRFLDVLRPFLSEYRVEEGPGDLMFSADCGEEKTLRGGVVAQGKKRLYFTWIKIFVGTSMEEMAGRLISGVRDWTTHQSNEFVRLRAGGVALDGGAVILPSAPEPRLATLVAMLAKRGAAYLGDEVLNLDPVLRRVHRTGLPLLVDADDAALVGVADAPRRARSRRRRVRQVWPVRPEQLGASVADPSPVRWVVFPRFDPEAPTELRDIGRAESLFRFTGSGMNLHIWQDRALHLMRDVLAEARVAELVVGDPDEAADRLLAVADGGGG